MAVFVRIFVGAPIFDREKRKLAAKIGTNEDLSIMNPIEANTNQIWVQNH